MAHVVLIEDDTGARSTLRRLLELRGHEVVDFADAGPALRSADLSKADVVVTDLMMPTPAEWIIRQIAGAIPVIVISGTMTAQEWDQVGEIGVVCFLQKSFRAAEVG
jgi:DNA-binding NtrC family response regulator